MKPLWLLNLAGLRKAKAHSVSLLVMILLSSAFMNIGLLTWRNYESSFDYRAAQLNTSDIFAVLQNHDPVYTLSYEQELRKDTRTKAMETRDVLLLNGSCAYAGSATNRLLVAMNTKDHPIMNRYEFVSKAAVLPQHPIYLPYLFQVGGGYEIGDAFSIEITGGNYQNRTYTYEVAGFFDEIMLGTINSSTTGFLLEDEDYQKLSASFHGTLDAKLFLVQISDPSQREMYATDHTILPVSKYTLYDSNIYDTLRMSRTITSSIGSMLVISFSLILSLIAMVIIRFDIINTIEQDMQNIGALKAIGYTGKQIAGAILLQFLLISATGIFLGILISYAVLPYVIEMFAQQTGMLWEQSFDGGAACITSFILLTSVSLLIMQCTSKARKLQPITALRTGIATHNFRKNRIPLASVNGPLEVVLALKQLFQEFKRSLMIAVIITGITFAAGFSGILYYNISLNFDNFLVTTVGEVVDLQVDAWTETDAQQLRDEFDQMEEVRKTLYYQIGLVKSTDGAAVYMYTTHDFKDFDYQNLVYDGRFPQYDNEVAIGGLLSENIDKTIGDTITLERGEQTFTYLITGLIQGSNYMGHDAAMSKEGFRHLVTDYTDTSISLYLKEGIDGDTFLETLKETYGDTLASARNVRKSMEASMITYRQIVSILVIIIALITAAMIALTLYLVIKTSLLKKKKELGIQKAIGFTTCQLVLQNALSFLPMIIISASIGAIITYWTTNPILSVLFSGIGMMKVAFAIPLSMLVLLIVIISSFGFLVCILISMRIRKVSAYALISE